MSRSSLGVALLDADGAESGWACLYPDQPFRFRTTSDLSSRHIWWTDVEPVEFTSRGYNRIPRLRSAEFLGVSMSRICLEIGVSPQVRSHQSHLLSRLAATVSAWGRSLGINGVPRHSYVRAFRRALVGRRRGFRSTEPMLEAVGSTWTTWTDVCNPPSSSEKVVLQLRRHRATHALEILDYPSPALGARWAYLDRATVAGKNVSEIDLNRPTLLLCKVEGAREEGAGKLFPEFTAAGTGSSVFMRRYAPGLAWASVPVARFMAERFRISVVDAIQADASGQPLFEVRQCPGEAMASYAFGILLHARYASFLFRDDSKRDITPTAAWICGLDRVFLLRQYELLRQSTQNVELVGYGMGALHVAIDRRDADQVMSSLHRTDLHPNLPDAPFSTSPISSDASGRDIQRALIFRGQSRSLLALDQYLVEAHREAPDALA